MGTINPLQQQTHTTYSLLLPAQHRGPSAEAETACDDHSASLFSVSEHSRCGSVTLPKSEMRAAFPSRFSASLIPFIDFMNGWSLTLCGGAVVNTAWPKNVLLFWACFGMGIKHPGCVRRRGRELWIFKRPTRNYRQIDIRSQILSRYENS